MRYILPSYDPISGSCDCFGTKDEPCWGNVHLDEDQCFCEYCDYRLVCQGHENEEYKKSDYECDKNVNPEKIYE
jgi:hypothetical protein